MTRQIGAIGAGSTQGIQPRQPKEDSQQEIKQELKQEQTQNRESLVDASTTLDFLAQTSAVQVQKPVKETRTINVGDWVTPEQAARIAGFVTGFVDEVAENFNAAQKEFPEMSDNIAMVVALSKFENENY